MQQCLSHLERNLKELILSLFQPKIAIKTNLIIMKQKILHVTCLHRHKNSSSTTTTISKGQRKFSITILICLIRNKWKASNSAKNIPNYYFYINRNLPSQWNHNTILPIIQKIATTILNKYIWHQTSSKSMAQAVRSVLYQHSTDCSNLIINVMT